LAQALLARVVDDAADFAAQLAAGDDAVDEAAVAADQAVAVVAVGNAPLAEFLGPLATPGRIQPGKPFAVDEDRAAARRNRIRSSPGFLHDTRSR
jgi:hypothetical protein